MHISGHFVPTATAANLTEEIVKKDDEPALTPKQAAALLDTLFLFLASEVEVGIRLGETLRTFSLLMGRIPVRKGSRAEQQMQFLLKLLYFGIPELKDESAHHWEHLCDDLSQGIGVLWWLMKEGH